MAEESGITLDYASPKPREWRYPNRELHLIARFCGVAPLAAGILIYVLYLVTRWHGFAFFGFLLLPFAALAFGLGMICLGVYEWQIRGAPPERAEPARRLRKIDSAILLAAVPIAIFCTWSGSQFVAGEQTVTLSIANTGSLPIDSMTLGAAPNYVTLGPIPAGGTHEGAQLKVRQVRELHYTIKQGNRIRTGTWPRIDGHFDSVVVTITDDSVTAQRGDW